MYQVRGVVAGKARSRPKLGPVASAAESGDARAVQVALRDRLAAAIDDPATSARDLAALTRRLQEVADRIAEDDAAAEDMAASVASAEVEDDSFDPDDL